MRQRASALGAPLDRIEGHMKVTGAAPYAHDHQEERLAYAVPVQSTIAKGRIVSIDTRAAQALPGVVAVLSHERAPRLASATPVELAVLQSAAVAYRGQFVAAVVAETLESARQAAGLVMIDYEEQPHDVTLRADRSDLYTPDHVNPSQETDTACGDVDAALAA